MTIANCHRGDRVEPRTERSSDDADFISEEQARTEVQFQSRCPGGLLAMCNL